MADKIEISKEGYLELINRICKSKEEERELALDRYRKVDDQMESNEHFILMGKNAVEFLKLVASSSNDMANIAKEIKTIVYKEDAVGGDVNINVTDGFKDIIAEKIEEMEKKKSGKTPDINTEE